MKENIKLCPDCGRQEASSFTDVEQGLCPKRYAYRDPDAEKDCIKHKQLLSRSHEVATGVWNRNKEDKESDDDIYNRLAKGVTIGYDDYFYKDSGLPLTKEDRNYLLTKMNPGNGTLWTGKRWEEHEKEVAKLKMNRNYDIIPHEELASPHYPQDLIQTPQHKNGEFEGTPGTPFRGVGPFGTIIDGIQQYKNSKTVETPFVDPLTHPFHMPDFEPIPTIQVARIHQDAKMPTKSYDYALGWDFYCVPDEEWIIFADGVSEKKGYALVPHSSHTFHTGIKVAITPSNYGFLLRDRSGLGVNDICVTAGVIEGTYRGEYLVHLINHGKTPRFFYSGDKLVQGVLTEVIPATIMEVEFDKDLPPSERGEKGFGSSG